MNIVFLGTGEIGVPTLQSLAQSPRHSVVGVISQPDRPSGRSLKQKPTPVKVAAEALGLTVHQPEKLRGGEVMDLLRSFNADLFFVAAYGQILRKDVLELPRHGCVNLHTSLLPRHRGASPIQTAILSGDDTTGVTLMQMDEGLDTGDILLQQSCPILPTDTAGVLHDRLALMAPPMVAQLLESMVSGTLQPQPQEESLATYAHKLEKSHGRIDWSRPATEIDRQIRGLHPWPGAFTFLPGDQLLKIHKATLTEGTGSPASRLPVDPKRLIVASGEQAIELLEIQAAGGKRLSTPDFLRGFPLPETLVFS